MISVVVPSLNAEADLPRSLSALIPAAMEGVVREVVIADGGSSDASAEIADAAGAAFLRAERGRGQQLAAGAAAAKGPWLLFLHADTALEEGWEREASAFIREIERGETEEGAAVFRFGLDDSGIKPALLTLGVGLRCRILRMPYGDQGLLISKQLYDRIGGFRPLTLMEDVDLVRRLGRRRIHLLRSRAVTSARRYRAEGYFRRMLRNLTCLSLYYLRVPTSVLTRLYG
jgi:rSAM/selenodomain-associated transferase 2